MPARKHKGTMDKPWTDMTRQKIQASQIINRLQSFIFGKVEMQPHQVTAALGLLKKTIPDLSAVDLTGQVENIHYVISDQPDELDADAWVQKYALHGNPSLAHKQH